MKKLSLMIACLGIISATAFGRGHHKTNPQEGTKKQEAPKAQTAPKATETATPAKTTTTAKPAKAETKGETKGEAKPVQSGTAPKKAEAQKAAPVKAVAPASTEKK